MLPSRSFFGRRSRSRRVQRPVPEAHLVLAALGQLGLGGVPGEVPATGTSRAQQSSAAAAWR